MDSKIIQELVQAEMNKLLGVKVKEVVTANIDVVGDMVHDIMKDYIATAEFKAMALKEIKEFLNDGFDYVDELDLSCITKTCQKLINDKLKS